VHVFDDHLDGSQDYCQRAILRVRTVNLLRDAMTTWLRPPCPACSNQSPHHSRLDRILQVGSRVWWRYSNGRRPPASWNHVKVGAKCRAMTKLGRHCTVALPDSVYCCNHCEQRGTRINRVNLRIVRCCGKASRRKNIKRKDTIRLDLCTA
jgi:hypothetical protein